MTERTPDARGTTPPEGRVRAVIENVAPVVEGGRFAAKRVVGDRVLVEADCFADGHDTLDARVRWRRDEESTWQEVPMAPLGNDRWRGLFPVTRAGRYRFTVTAWVDAFLSWRHDFERRTDSDDLRLAARAGASLIKAAAARAKDADAALLAGAATRLAAGGAIEALRETAKDESLAAAMARHADRRFAATHPVEIPLTVDIARARFSTWYEMFPRSASPVPGRHGTFADCEALLPRLVDMGFDVLYLPPIHPIGRTRRKGRNNALAAGPDDVGSPWAIGAAEGGHKAIHPALGSHEEFRRLVARAGELGVAIALDIAYQCAPDHPYVAAHPAWFRKRPDGAVQYAENPPKKYEDIYPFDFESDDWQALWRELKSVLDFWIGEGVTMFRVDNPHTKAFPFWEWAIAEVKREHPEAIFLAEAFTRPKVMHRLAKIGFTQSYTYFTWRNTKDELTEYFTELTRGPGREYFRPNVWPNTPDILAEYLQLGGRPAFMARLVLAATLAASYGIYGPAFLHCERAPRMPGSEEYLDSEKYELRHWDDQRADTLAEFVARINRVRHENPALQSDASLAFFPTDNVAIIAYAKHTPDLDNIIFTVVNLDPHHVQSGFVDVDLAALGLATDTPYQVHDLLTGARYLWHGARNYVSLDPARVPAHVFRVRRHVRSERDFDYFL